MGMHGFQRLTCLSQEGWAIILRDPRDVAVSHVHYIAEMAPNHIHHRYYHEILGTFGERLEARIAGVPVELLEQASARPVLEPLPDLYQRIEPFLVVGLPTRCWSCITKIFSPTFLGRLPGLRSRSARLNGAMPEGFLSWSKHNHSALADLPQRQIGGRRDRAGHPLILTTGTC
jgi:hypothetical protein